jgi:hypothetical protein
MKSLKEPRTIMKVEKPAVCLPPTAPVTTPYSPTSKTTTASLLEETEAAPITQVPISMSETRVISETASLETKPNFPFTKLLPELRNMIYELVLICSSPFEICSPRRKTPSTTKQPFFALLLANKQLYEEGSYILFSRNIFLFSNLDYGSTTLPNIHGMLAFIKRIPPQRLYLIANIQLDFYLNSDLWSHRKSHFLSSGTPYQKWHKCYGPVTYGKIDGEIKDMNSMCRSVVRCFKGARRVRFEFGCRRRVRSSLEKGEWSENELAVRKVLECLMGAERLEVVGMRREDGVGLRRVVEGLGRRNGDEVVFERVKRCD